MTAQRVRFYQELSEQLPKDAKGLYPAPGFDPVPVYIFGENIEYFAAIEDGEEHAAILRGEITASGRNSSFIETNGPFPDLHMSFGDIRNPQLPEENFEYIILRDPPPFLYDDPAFYDAVNRILKNGGRIVFDSDDSENDLKAKKILADKGYIFEQVQPQWQREAEVYPDAERKGNKDWRLGKHVFTMAKKP